MNRLDFMHLALVVLANKGSIDNCVHPENVRKNFKNERFKKGTRRAKIISKTDNKTFHKMMLI
jgi:hypothetical protein